MSGKNNGQNNRGGINGQVNGQQNVPSSEIRAFLPQAVKHVIPNDDSDEEPSPQAALPRVESDESDGRLPSIVNCYSIKITVSWLIGTTMITGILYLKLTFLVEEAEINSASSQGPEPFVPPKVSRRPQATRNDNGNGHGNNGFSGGRGNNNGNGNTDGRSHGNGCNTNNNGNNNEDDDCQGGTLDIEEPAPVPIFRTSPVDNGNDQDEFDDSMLDELDDEYFDLGLEDEYLSNEDIDDDEFDFESLFAGTRLARIMNYRYWLRRFLPRYRSYYRSKRSIF